MRTQPAQSQPQARKKKQSEKAVILGRRFATVKVAKDRSFNVHEDLICSRSEYFKNLLQKNRKELDEECAICREGFEVTKDDVVHCQTCGQNLHDDCVAQWHTRGDDKRCPFCRAAWTPDSEAKTIKCQSLDVDGFDTYVKFIYGKGIATYTSESNNHDQRTLRLCKAWIVGNIVDDKEFKRAIIETLEEHIEDSNQLPGVEPMEYLFHEIEDRRRHGELHIFMLRIFKTKGSNVTSMWYDEIDSPWVCTFLKCLSHELLNPTV
ncbi:hypothetical protein BU24DRAFT_461279 [Aaosphaeria arxii CBS 175.79]|uniref:RING-type domain-containing protein n=1 Tax=Aaosphaeria arxii CBS 175.79 TaxID=1450172 RepID=A0A6A5XZC8_9PLEO|nr:uncharacterized protein BU24DRAFT_461279 [Aaosphaeria arxii CBS 175.79]KAF2018329.1 hypothetical protein BU24DRAFT_461279 [Aaosphaeria arxii CBS 175.79]